MSRYVFLAVALLPWPAGAEQLQEMPSVTIVAARDAEWGSYRHAYKAAARYERATRSRPLIQAHMQIRPRQPGLSVEGLRIELTGKTSALTIEVDAIGRATLPLLKQAYDEDAVLRLNRQAGFYRFSGRFTIREKDDGVYDAAVLRAACEQLLSAQREDGSLFRMWGKKCVGVRFIYPLASSDSAIEFRAGGKAGAIPAADGLPFEGGNMDLYKVATYRFADWPQAGEVIAEKRPLAIGTLYE
ncbi:MAG: hypothetical protein V4631_03370 [Pseudomonadota bacterium]